MVQKIDLLIRSHKMNEAKEALALIKIDRVPISERHLYAQLARRLNLPELSLKFLWHNIFEQRKPSSRDILEYASSIRKIGMNHQCLRTLKMISANDQVLLHRAFCYISLWDYENAKTDLIEFLRLVPKDDPRHLVARVNLVSTYIMVDDIGKADELLTELLPETKEKHFHLYLNCLELKIRILYESGKSSEAMEFITQAELHCTYSEDLTSLFIKKWALLTHLKAGRIESNSQAIEGFITKIRGEKHWESLRDWDFQVARIQKNTNLIDHVYFGTPFEGFRNRILREFEGEKKSYVWFDTRVPTQNIDLLDLLDPMSIPAAFGKTLHRLWILFASDFYRPWTIERLFDELCRGEAFDPFSSKKKVYRLIEELISVINTHHLPLEIRSTTRGYRMRPKGGGGMVVYRFDDLSSIDAFYKTVLIEKFGRTEFKSEDAVLRVPLSKDQWQRRLKSLKQSGHVEILGQGKATKYKTK